MRSFVTDWFGIVPDATSGESPDAIEAAEIRLGVSLPVAFREWFSAFGRLHSVWSAQDRLLAPHQWGWQDGVFTFARESQGVVEWGVRASDMQLLDPPVVVSSASQAAGWHEDSRMLTEFALQFAVLNAKWSSKPWSANGSTTSAAVRAMTDSYPRLPLPPWHWPSWPTTFHGTDDILIELHGDTWVWVTARSADAFAHVVRLATEAGMSWEYVSGSE